VTTSTLPGMPHSVSMTRAGMKLPKDLSLGQWTEIGQKLIAATVSIQWWWGDWWAYGGHAYGERRALVDDESWEGPNFQRLADMASVCRKFETSRRRELLGFSHHHEVAGLSAEEADQLLIWCEETIAETGKPRSTRTLRDRVRETTTRIMRTATERAELTAEKPKSGIERGLIPPSAEAIAKLNLSMPASNVLSLGITPASVPPPGSLVITEAAAKSAIDTDYKLARRDQPVSEIVRNPPVTEAVKVGMGSGRITRGYQRLPEGLQSAVIREDWRAIAKIVIERIPVEELADFGEWLLAYINDLRSHSELR
jgi:hypothetical protein